MLEVNDFDAIRISLATPEQIRNWSYGEVAKPETINYRTLKPERDGLFCERIFGPIKEFECSCGKYKRIRYKGIICDKCGVEVARSKVRRERMGHIELACPVGHIWFSRGIPSRLGLLLDMSPRNLERVLYFARYIITHVDGEACQEALNQIEEKKQQKITNHDEGLEAKVLELEQNGAKVGEINKLRKDWAEEKALLKEQFSIEIDQIKALRVRMLLSENQYHAVKRDYGEIVKAGMGAEAILELVKTINLEELRDHLLQELQSSSGQKHRKASKQLQVVEALRRSGNKPETMILTILPVLPPDLRPMVQLDGGRFATSDLNDLYRRVINRNNRLRHLLEIGAPEIIVRNEKRMLQEAVDSLIDNERRGRAASVSGTHKLKSLSDMLRSKQGRFRQNLLGKRVDYSGRSVIVVGPELKLHQCGLPRRMALELFKPFIMHRLIAQGLAHNIRSSRRLVERAKPEVYDILEEVVKERPVLLNRAPTLHRLSIQAFEPVLIDGSAIQIHPLVCAAFNADFDGDQMAVHLPLSKAAIREARSQLLSTRNMLVPSNGEPLVTPTLDMVLGCFYLTSMESGVSAKKIIFGSFEEARLSYELGIMNLRAEIEVRDKKTNGQRIKTTIGRIIFNEVLPPELGFLNKSVDRAELKHVVTTCYRLLGHEDMGTLLDNLKQMGFHFATKSGTTIGMNDIKVPVDKPELLQQAEERVALIDNQYEHGLITEDEKYNGVIEVWSETTDKITESISRTLDRYGGVYTMASSGAKGNISQIRQMAGIRGLMTDPSGKIIDFPIKSSLREGHSVLEYFISTHGARKGLADTALRTSNSGYLTRRLIDVAQDVITREFDCDTNDGTWVTAAQAGDLLPAFAERITGRLAASQIINSKTGEIVVDRNEEINELKVKDIDKAGIKKIHVRSPVKCQSRHGCCQRCYGRDLGRGNIVGPGTAVGIIAAQSIGEPGTQLTLRTFHTGGVVGLDITTGLPRVEELFEVRSPKVQAVISEIDGVVDVIQNDERRTLQVTRSEIFHDEYPLSAGAKVEVKDGQWVDIGTVLLVSSAKAKGKKGTKGTKGTKGVLADSQSVIARVSGEVVIDEKQLSIKYEEQEEREYDLPPAARIRVQSGDLIKAGDQLTEGPLNPQDILRVLGTEAVQQYLVDEVQKVYRSQGVNINDKHIEVIVHQMLGKVRVDSSGDTELVPDELVGKFRYEDVNAKVLAEGGEPATAHTIMVGITRASLSSDSWLAAASFQETTRVLTEAAISGKVDKLSGLKENVIIGKLIPAYCPEPENEQERLLEEVSEQAEELRMGDVEEKSPLEEEAADEIREVSEN